jgi:hypothetical protein
MIDPRAARTLITTSLAVVMAAIGIEAAAVRIGGQDCGEKKREAKASCTISRMDFMPQPTVRTAHL